MNIENTEERIRQDRHYMIAMSHLKNGDWTLAETVIYLRKQYALAFQQYKFFETGSV